jgi:hypothetical protein
MISFVYLAFQFPFRPCCALRRQIVLADSLNVELTSLASYDSYEKVSSVESCVPLKWLILAQPERGLHTLDPLRIQHAEPASQSTRGAPFGFNTRNRFGFNTRSLLYEYIH